ncbi:MAG TPA: hypothetical protein VG295_13410 [Solirubrobacteraceae bacterium]|nr:hypothetical protein [Solirubrobacteraceae bacterium]
MLEAGQRRHAGLGLVLVGARRAHREFIQRRAPLGEEAAEAGGDHGEERLRRKWVAAGGGLDPAVGERVAEEGRHDTREGDREPPPLRVQNALPHGVKAGDVRHAHAPGREKQGHERHQSGQLRSLVVYVLRASA